MQDYAGAGVAERGRCHHLVYGSDDGHPAHCPEPTVSSGWRREGQGRWYVVGACARHSSSADLGPADMSVFNEFLTTQVRKFTC